MSHLDVSQRRVAKTVTICLIGVVLLAIVVLNSWVCDDAYITMRTVERVLAGNGPVWNLGERVQAYTHPLWMLALVPVHTIVGNAYFSLLALGLFCTVLTVWLVARTGGNRAVSALALLSLAASPTFVHFSTSGLEGPGTQLLLVLFAICYVDESSSLFRLALLTSGLALNRPDALLLVAPALLEAFVRTGKRVAWVPAARRAIAGFAPLVAWGVFSLIYYGSVVPNTAYAKLAHGIPRLEMIVQGLSYFVSFATFDPVGLVLLAIGFALAIRTRNRFARMLMMGVLLYSGYIVWIGGDFMPGRLIGPSVVLSAWVLAQYGSAFVTAPRRLAVAVFSILVLGALPARHVLTPLREAHIVPLHAGPVPPFQRHWVNDEQSFYFQETSLIKYRGTPPNHPWFERGLEWRRIGGVHVFKNIGFAGYAAGPNVHIIDPYALSDPFLARLPASRNPDWHVGHFHREVPQGYVRSVEQGKCMMKQPELCLLFDRIRTVTRGPLFDSSRWRAILELMTYRPSQALAHELRYPTLRRVSSSDLPSSLTDSGTQVAFPGRCAGLLRLQVTPCQHFEVRGLDGGVETFVTRSATQVEGAGCVLELNSDARVDGVWILPLERPGPYQLTAAELRCGS